MKKFLVILLAIVLVSGLVLSGCGGAETPADQVNIDILGGSFGSNSYWAAFALADLIMKHSTWLRATAFESESMVVTLDEWTKNPELPKTQMTLSSVTGYYSAVRGIEPYSTPYPTLKAIATNSAYCPTFMTLDMSLQARPEDFLGKKIAFTAPNGVDTYVGKTLFEYGWGVPFDQFDVEYLGWVGSPQALVDGTVDISFAGVTVLGEAGPSDFIPSTGTQQMLAQVKQPVNFISFPPEVIEKAHTDSGGFPIAPRLVPGGALGPNQPNDYVGITFGGLWYADEAMDDEIVYEITRIIYEYYQDLWTSHILLTYVTPETMGSLVYSWDELHPGAREFYEEHDLEILTFSTK